MDSTVSSDTYPCSIAKLPIHEAKETLLNCDDNNIFSLSDEGRNVYFYILERPSEADILDLLSMLKPIIANTKNSALRSSSLSTDLYGQNPIFIAARQGLSEIIPILVEHGFDPGLVDNLGQTPLYYAARQGANDALVFLLQNGCSAAHLDNELNDALAYAAQENHRESCEILIKAGADMTNKNMSRKYASTIAKLNGHKELATLLEGYRKKPRSTAMKPQVLCYYNTEREVYEPATGHMLTIFELLFPQHATWLQTKPGQTPVADLATVENFNIPLSFQNLWRPFSIDLVDQLLANPKVSELFSEPVDPEKWNIPDYLTIILNPMDLGTIKSNLAAAKYDRFTHLVNDINLVFENCMTYNKKASQIGRFAKRTKVNTEQKINEFALSAALLSAKL